MSGTLRKALVRGLLLALAATASSHGQNTTRVHDPSSIIKCGDTYWIFSTGGGIGAMYSTDLVDWHAGPSPYSRDAYPEWINTCVSGFRGHFWAPECYYMNGKYYLYYSCSTFGSRVSCIGLATNPTLDPNDPDYEWTDEGLVISSDTSSEFNTIDPAIFSSPAGGLYMSFGSWSNGIRIVELNSVTGKPLGGKAYSVATASDAEASYVVYRNGYYYLFFNRGNCCRGVDSTYYIQVGRSTSPIGGYVDMSGRELAGRGGATVLSTHQNRIGPGCIARYVENGTEWTTFHYYDGHDEGRSKLAIGRMEWDDSTDWPEVTLDWVDAGRYSVTNVNSQLVWQVPDSNDVVGQAITQGPWEDLVGQKWDFAAMGNGYFMIVNAQGGLAAPGMGDAFADDITLGLQAFSGYHLARTNAGDYVFSARADGRAIEVANASTEIGTPLVMGDYTGADHQRFELRDLDRTINNPPAVSILSPPDGQAFSPGDAITLEAAASDSDGTVVLVEFYNGSTKLGEVTEAPYTYTWDNAVGGCHALIVRATDDAGDVRAAGINVTVGRPR